MLDALSAVLVESPLFRALPAVAVLVGYWGVRFSPDRLHGRRVVLAGFLAAGATLVLSRLVQNLLPTPRPIHDPALRELFRVGATLGRDYNSFPSDHAAFLPPLVWAVSRLAPWLGVLTSLLLALVLAARVFQGLHFPVDLAGGLVIGLFAIAVFGRPTSRLVTATMAMIEDAQVRWPWSTACMLFLLAYGYATMFVEVRDFLYGVIRFLLGPSTGR